MILKTKSPEGDGEEDNGEFLLSQFLEGWRFPLMDTFTLIVCVSGLDLRGFTMSENQSITWWVQELKQGDENAASELWQRYFHRLVGLARQRLGDGARRVVDEEDIAIRTFRSLCEGVEQGRMDGIGDRDDLWRLLATITARKSAGQIRSESRQKRGEGKVRGHSVFEDGSNEVGAVGFDRIVSEEPTPEFLCLLAEEHLRLTMGLGEEPLVQIAQWKLDGWSAAEIAGKLGISKRSVERKLERIREYWKRELAE